MKPTIAAVAAMVAFLGCASQARAETLPEMVPRLIQESGWLRAHYPGEQANKTGRATSFETVGPAAAPVAVLGSDLRVGVVARDWGGGYSLTGGKELLFDRMRMIRSNRMAVTRVSWSGGHLLPYAELSFGQWRADTDLVPWLKSDAAAAGQVAMGLELHVASRCAVAWDLEETQIYSDQQNVPATRLLASFAALRAEF